MLEYCLLHSNKLESLEVQVKEFRFEESGNEKLWWVLKWIACFRKAKS